AGLVATNSEAVVVDPRRSTTVYAGSLGAGVYKSTDGANTWRLVGEKPYFPQALAIDPLRPTLVWASSYPGLLKSANAGTTWRLVLNGYHSCVAVDARHFGTGTQAGPRPGGPEKP